jgi:hypothetical protein
MLYSFSPLINAINAENIAITSVGKYGALPVIDGDGEKWQKWSCGGDLWVQKSGRTPAYKAIRSEFNNADLPIEDQEYSGKFNIKDGVSVLPRRG